MKKLLSIAIMLLAVLTASAQGWTKTYHAGDELKGTKASYIYKYEDKKNGSFMLFGWDRPYFCITTSNGIFNANTSYNGNSDVVPVRVGAYRVSTGELIAKFDFNLRTSVDYGYREAYEIALNKSEKDAVLAIFKALLGTDICIRFVCSRFQDADFDLVVPCYCESVDTNK